MKEAQRKHFVKLNSCLKSNHTLQPNLPNPPKPALFVSLFVCENRCK